MKMPRHTAWLPLIALTLTACGGNDEPALATPVGKAPLVIGHRGAPGTLPEHTLEGYRQAIEQGTNPAATMRAAVASATRRPRCRTT